MARTGLPRRTPPGYRVKLLAAPSRLASLGPAGQRRCQIQVCSAGELPHTPRAPKQAWPVCRAEQMYFGARGHGPSATSYLLRARTAPGRDGRCCARTGRWQAAQMGIPHPRPDTITISLLLSPCHHSSYVNLVDQTS